MNKILKIVGIIFIIITVLVCVILFVKVINKKRTQMEEQEIINELNESAVNQYTINDLNSNSQIAIDNHNDYTETSMKAVIVKVYEDTNKLLVIRSQNTSEMLYINYKNENIIEFKENQEIIVYYNGLIITTYPEQISDVSRIEIVNENSNIIIPTEVLRYAHSSQDNVNIEVKKFDIDEIIFTITDTNEIPYEYLTNYKIYQETKNDNYTGQGQMTEATANSTSAYTRYWF